MNASAPTACTLCAEPGGRVIVQGGLWRVVRVDDANFPAFYRLIWRDHVAEFSDLIPADRVECMEVVARIEQVLREALKPTKVNIASLGNMVPHLHWHVIARFDWDSHFPNPIWGAAQRGLPEGDAEARLAASLPELDRRMLLALS